MCLSRLVACLAGAILLAGCGFPVRASQPAKIPRVGFMFLQPRLEERPAEASFIQGLYQLGYVEGQNIIVDVRYADNDRERLRELAVELIKLNPNVIVSGGDNGARVLQAQTKTIPIVATNSDDP